MSTGVARKVSVAQQTGGGNRGYTLSASCEAETLCCCGFYGHCVKRQPKIFRHIGAHLLYVWRHFGDLSDDGDINIADTEAPLPCQTGGLTQEHSGIGSSVALIAVGKMVAYVAQGGGAENCVTEGMERHIGIAMPQKTEFMGYLNPAYDEAPPF